MLTLVCPKCRDTFTMGGDRKKMVSCPSCSGMVSVEDSVVTVCDGAKVSRQGKSIVIEPSLVSGKMKCRVCSSTFLFERPADDKHTKPVCPHCRRSDVESVSPLVSAVTSVESLPKLSKKAMRTLKNRENVVGSLRSYFGGFESLVARAALPESDAPMIAQAVLLHESILKRVEEVFDERLEQFVEEMSK